MELNDLIVEEIKVISNELHWVIRLKQTHESICKVKMNEKDNAVMEIAELVFCDHLKQDEGRASAMECLLNQLYYRKNVRKVFICLSERSIIKQEMIELFGFHLDFVCERENEQPGVQRMESYSLYKEEYIGWLRKKGKILGFLKVHEMKIVFLMIASAGLILFGMDLYRESATLFTALYAYVTGIGASGALACMYMDARRKKGEHHAG